MHVRKMLLIAAALIATVATSCASPEGAADAIYYGGPIVTMTREGDRVEALAVADGRILKLGTEADVMALKGTGTKLVDLNDRCLMPGFIDPHSHVLFQSLKFSTVNLDPYPIGDIKTIDRDNHFVIFDGELKLGFLNNVEQLFFIGHIDTGLHGSKRYCAIHCTCIQKARP